ncbi:hypothetical protein [Paenibacillus endoradicis]|uniref:hypothetical protein n=1 Tax=Paenibacillus endoradicis TaxID=2972487 RepID=UPI002158EB5E|nr:hypothetical protein [Paenibacillus endoradicis]MCR8656894.1 hypothetical protein [Paenibacillus endoradicis]
MLNERLEPTVVIKKETNEVVAYGNIYDYDVVESIGWLGYVIVSPAPPWLL